MKKARILTASWHPGSANSIVPVIKKLSENADNEVISLSYGPSGQILDKNSIFYLTPSQRSIEDISKLVKIIKPDFVLSGTASPDKENPVTLEQATIYSSKMQHIPSITISDWWASIGRFDDLNDGTRGKFLPTKIAVADIYAERNFLDEGFNRSELIVTGNPHFDDIPEIKKSFDKEKREKVRTDLGISPDSYLFTFASQPIKNDFGNKWGYTEADALKGFLSSLEKLKGKKNFEVLVKVHPRENLEEVVKITEEFSFPVKVDKPYDTKKAVLASDAICSMFSTVLVESSYLDKPSISFQPNLIGKDSLVTNSIGVSIPVYSFEEMDRISEKILFDESYNNELAVKRRNFSTDGRATERVVNLIYEMLKEN